MGTYYQSSFRERHFQRYVPGIPSTSVLVSQFSWAQCLLGIYLAKTTYDRNYSSLQNAVNDSFLNIEKSVLFLYLTILNISTRHNYSKVIHGRIQLQLYDNECSFCSPKC